MKPYKLMPAAEEDLAEIVDRIAEDSPRNARKVFDKIHADAKKLAEMPLIGHTREDITDKPLRFWAVYSWLIVYRPETSPLEILRIVHGARDLAHEPHLEG